VIIRYLDDLFGPTYLKIGIGVSLIISIWWFLIFGFKLIVPSDENRAELLLKGLFWLHLSGLYYYILEQKREKEHERAD
jgi:hypothetical protein